MCDRTRGARMSERLDPRGAVLMPDSGINAQGWLFAQKVDDEVSVHLKFLLEVSHLPGLGGSNGPAILSNPCHFGHDRHWHSLLSDVRLTLCSLELVLVVRPWGAGHRRSRQRPQEHCLLGDRLVNLRGCWFVVARAPARGVE